MFGCHKPKIYRSPSGCCICGAKSSSSRFTGSERYESEFAGCFRTGKECRSGDICNACVLLVKRWRKLPKGTDRHWQHMLDARAGNNNRSIGRGLGGRGQGRVNKDKRNTILSQYANSPLPKQTWNKSSAYDSSDDSDLSDCEGFNRRQRQKRRHQQKRPASQCSSFLDLTYWKKTKVCCGTIFVGANGEAMIDARMWHPCVSCRPLTSSIDMEDGGSTAGHDVSDDASDVSDQTSVASSQGSTGEGTSSGAFEVICGRRKSFVELEL